MKSAEEIVELVRAKINELDNRSADYFMLANDNTICRKDRMFYKKVCHEYADKSVEMRLLLKKILGDEE